jgi:hypothetical protein
MLSLHNFRIFIGAALGCNLLVNSCTSIEEAGLSIAITQCWRICSTLITVISFLREGYLSLEVDL